MLLGLKTILNCLFSYVCVCLHVYVCTTFLKVPMEAEEGYGFLDIRVADTFGCWELNLDPFQTQ